MAKRDDRLAPSEDPFKYIPAPRPWWEMPVLAICVGVILACVLLSGCSHLTPPLGPNQTHPKWEHSKEYQQWRREQDARAKEPKVYYP